MSFPTVVPQRSQDTIRYGTVLELRDSRDNFKVRPDGGGRTVILTRSRRCPFKMRDRVMLDCIRTGDCVDFADGYSTLDRSWPTKEVIRRMSMVHWGKVLREGLAAAFASLPPLASIVLYDPLLLGCKLPYGGKASHYMLAIVGKTAMDVRIGTAFARSWELRGEEPAPFIAYDPPYGPFMCPNHVHAGAYRTQYVSPEIFLDPLLSQADHGQVRSLPVPGLVRVGFDNRPWIEPEVIRLCGESATFMEAGAGKPE